MLTLRVILARLEHNLSGVHPDYFNWDNNNLNYANSAYPSEWMTRGIVVSILKIYNSKWEKHNSGIINIINKFFLYPYE